MIRVLGVDLAAHKVLYIALLNIYGIGRTTAGNIVAQCGLNQQIRVKDLRDNDISKLKEVLRNYSLEGDLKRIVRGHIATLVAAGSYRGKRHTIGLPLRGQRTRSNGKTAKKFKFKA